MNQSDKAELQNKIYNRWGLLDEEIFRISFWI